MTDVICLLHVCAIRCMSYTIKKNWIEISMGKKAFPISDFQNMYAIIYAPLYLNLSSTQNPLLTLSLILKSE